jgi:hypothetical protein
MINIKCKLAARGGYTDCWEGFVKTALRWVRCRDINTEFHKDWFRHSKVDRERYTGTQTAWR